MTGRFTSDTYCVSFLHDEDSWIGQVYPTSLGVHSNGSTLEEARLNLREALALAIGDERAAAAIFFE